MDFLTEPPDKRTMPTQEVPMSSDVSSSRQIEVLLVCANPRGTSPLRTAEEERTLKEAIRLSPHRESISITVLNAATIDDVRRELLKKTYQIVHFSGHGTHTGLVFEDAAGRLMVPDSAALAELLQRRGASVALLNACYSLSTGSFTSLGVDYTIAMEGPIADDAAIEFARGFYDALGAGFGVAEAYDEGLSCARLKNFQPNAVLLKRGETHQARQDDKASTRSSPQRDSAQATLVGIAIDTSGSMEQSIGNDRNRQLSRLEGVREALLRYGQHFRSTLSTSSEVTALRLFAYAFGLRSGEVADMLSLVRAARSIDLVGEIERRKTDYVAEARRQADSYSGLAGLARSYGFGGAISELTRAATAAGERTIRDRIATEIASLLTQKAADVGDTTVTPAELAELFDDTATAGFGDLEPLIYGDTPMAAAADAVARRFERESKVTAAQQIFLLLSDGEPTDGDPSAAFAGLRERGITIITCYVTNQDVVAPRLLRNSADSTWPAGAKLMFKAASVLEQGDAFARQLLRNGWIVEPDARLFLQVNHSELLSDFVQTVVSTFSHTVDALPKGR